MEKYENLKAALLKAINAASHAQTKDDDGTCNFDSPVLRYHKMGYQKQKAIDTIESVGLNALKPSSSFWRGCLVLSGMTKGQANCRTVMAEAFSKCLKDNGIESGMYYQMD